MTPFAFQSAGYHGPTKPPTSFEQNDLLVASKNDLLNHNLQPV